MTKPARSRISLRAPVVERCRPLNHPEETLDFHFTHHSPKLSAEMSLMPTDIPRSDASPQTSSPVGLNRTCQVINCMPPIPIRASPRCLIWVLHRAAAIAGSNASLHHKIHSQIRRNALGARSLTLTVFFFLLPSKRRAGETKQGSKNLSESSNRSSRASANHEARLLSRSLVQMETAIRNSPYLRMADPRQQRPALLTRYCWHPLPMIRQQTQFREAFSVITKRKDCTGPFATTLSHFIRLCMCQNH